MASRSLLAIVSTKSQLRFGVLALALGVRVVVIDHGGEEAGHGLGELEPGDRRPAGRLPGQEGRRMVDPSIRGRGATSTQVRSERAEMVRSGFTPS